MSVSVPTIRFDAARVEQARRLLTDACAELSTALGHPPEARHAG